MIDLVNSRQVAKSGQLLLGPGDYVCAATIENLAFHIKFFIAPGEPKISWEQSGPTGLNLIVRGDTANPLGTMFTLNNVGTLHGERLNLFLLVRGIGNDPISHAREVVYNFTVG